MSAKRLLLPALLAVLIVRLWLMPLPSSFWTDETATAFIVRYGLAHPSLAVAPQLTESIYNWLPRLVASFTGFSEVAYRLPSILAMAIALALIALLARRLIHRDAAWIVVFACLAMRGFNFDAADARPYGLGMATMAGAMWFLVAWLDSSRWRHAVGFIVLGVLLWRVQPVYWPFYGVFAGYVAARIFWKETSITWARALLVFAVLVVGLIPEAIMVVRLRRHALAHVIAAAPHPRDLFYSLVPWLVLGCGASAWLVSRFLRKPDALTLSRATIALIALWWLWNPLCLFIFSRVSGVSLFVPRYYSLALPGAALVASTLILWQLPRHCWMWAAAIVGLVGLILGGSWRMAWPVHTNQNWRSAAQAINQLAPAPVVFFSPFIEGSAPEWKPDYPLPSLLYAPLVVYPLRTRVYPFPIYRNLDAEPFAARLTQSTLAPAGRFVLYGHKNSVSSWLPVFQQRPDLAGWTSRRPGDFGDIEVVEFTR